MTQEKKRKKKDLNVTGCTQPQRNLGKIKKRERDRTSQTPITGSV